MARRSRQQQPEQQFFTIEGIEEPKRPTRRPRIYLYSGMVDGYALLRTPDFEIVRDMLDELGIHAMWSGLRRGLLIKPKYLPDLVAACQKHRYYVRVKETDVA